MFHNILKVSGVIFVTAIIFLFWCVNAGAVGPTGPDHCTDHAVGKFTFSVGAPIGVEVNVEEADIGDVCPGCSREWCCFYGPYMQFDVTGELTCAFHLEYNSVGGYSDDRHVYLDATWARMDNYETQHWTQNMGSSAYNYVFLDDHNGDDLGIACFRCYIIEASATCEAKAKEYKWPCTVTVNYICTYDQIVAEGGGHGHHDNP